MKCLVGMSGGVDSSTTAVLMKKKYSEVIGCTFRMFDSQNTEDSIACAQKVASDLEIKHVVIDCRADFKKHVMDGFANSYKNGSTPNPCILCNKFVKFRFLEEAAKKYDADVLATGHYARIIKFENGRAELHQAKYLPKDQSYFLYKLSEELLRKTEFPLGDFQKSEVREMAASFGLHVAQKSESQDICFIPGGDYVAFIKNYIGDDFSKSGEIIDEDGHVLGLHDGTINYTIGQRKGLHLSGGPFFVKVVQPELNRIVVTDKNGVKSNRIDLEDVNFINEEFLGACEVKIRSANKKFAASVMKDNEKYFVELHEPAYGIAPGQHCVFFVDDQVLGGGRIKLG